MIKTSIKVSCIILAGGEGKRAGGEDKGLIAYKGKPLIEHVIDKVSPQVDDIVISANRNINTYKQFSNTVINDLSNRHQGPLAGIAACLQYCKHEYTLVVACDMPSLPDNLVEKLSNAILNNSVCIATLNNRHQLALLIKNNLTDSISSRINNNQLKFKHWVDSVSFSSVSFDDNPEAFLNLNTITDQAKHY